VLAELSNMSARAAEHLHLAAGESFDPLERNRQELRYLAALMIQYSLGMSSDDCGGLSEYSHFFSTMRRVLGIPDTRQEIRDEIHDVLGIVESGYLEEQRRHKREEKRSQRERDRIQARTDRHKDARKKRMETTISVIGAITLPFVIIAGIFGMNLHDLPDFSFWPLLFFTSMISALSLVALLFWQSIPLPKLPRLLSFRPQIVDNTNDHHNHRLSSNSSRAGSFVGHSEIPSPANHGTRTPPEHHDSTSSSRSNRRASSASFFEGLRRHMRLRGHRGRPLSEERTHLIGGSDADPDRLSDLGHYV
jgi:hypothetical protein